jgi:broad specificity phosphatase PhoE
MARLLLTRHGETRWNLERRYQGHGNSALTERGVEQARCLARRLADEPINAVYASDLERTRLTADAIVAGRGLPVVLDPAWRELNYGTWEGLTREEIAARYPDAWAGRLADPAHAAPPGGESRFALQQRAVAALTALRAAHPDQTVLVVTHSGLLMALGAWLHGIDIGTGPLPRSRHCGLTCVRWDTADPLVEVWDDTAHVDALAT